MGGHKNWRALLFSIGEGGDRNLQNVKSNFKLLFICISAERREEEEWGNPIRAFGKPPPPTDFFAVLFFTHVY